MAAAMRRITKSSGNVFRDLGFARGESAHLAIRADLMIRLQSMIEERRLPQRETARLLRVSQPRVSDLMRGRIDLFSADTLIELLSRLGADVRVTVRTRRTPKRAA